MKKIAIRLRIGPPTRRSALDRLKAKLYYRKHRAKLRAQRRRYLRQHKSILKHRKLFQRYKPQWYKKPHHAQPRAKKFKVRVPKMHKVPKLPKIHHVKH